MTDLAALHREPAIQLRAVDDGRNIFRDYQIYRSVDLFGAPVVDTWWGRINTAGQLRRRSFGTNGEALAHVRRILQTRNGALRRCGAAYTPM